MAAKKRGKQRRITDGELGIATYPKSKRRSLRGTTPARLRLIAEKKRAIKLTRLLLKVDAMLAELDEKESP